MRLITDADVANTLTMGDAIVAMRSAFVQFGHGAGAVLARNRATAAYAGESATISAMGAALPQSGVVGTKVYATVNGQFDFVIVLFSSETGKVLVTLEANELTRLRTAAATAVAIEALKPPQAKTLAVFGAGTQARAHIEAVTGVHAFEEVLVCARSGAQEFADHITSTTGLLATVCSALQAASKAEVVLTCTRSATPLFVGQSVKPGTLIAAVGSSKPLARELDDALLARAAHIVVEWRAAALSEAGEFAMAPAGVIDPMRVRELGQILAAPGNFHRAPQDVVVYKSVGIGLEDVALAKLVYERIC